MKTKVCVLGLGYIGLPTSLLIANSGIKTLGFDIDKNKIGNLNKGKLFFEEKGLRRLFNEVKNKKTFSVSTKLENSDVFIISVPTPVKRGSADLKYVFKALDLIKPYFKKNNLIIIESTVGPRDCVDKIIPKIEKWNIQFKFAHCTERAIPGNTIDEMVNNDRVIGGIDKKSSLLAKKIYSKFSKGNIYLTDTITAAACKVMENTFRNTNIALANEFAKLASHLNFDVWQAIQLANKHPRVNIHYPGPGVGGHCIPVDPWFFVNKRSKNSIIKLSLEINEKMPRYICNNVKALISKHQLKNPKIGLLGFAYKKNVNDYREAPAETIINTFKKEYKIFVNDPYVKMGDFVDLDYILSKSDVIVLITDHDDYRNIKFSKYSNVKFVYDTRNLFNINNFTKSKTKLYKLGSRINSL